MRSRATLALAMLLGACVSAPRSVGYEPARRPAQGQLRPDIARSPLGATPMSAVPVAPIVGAGGAVQAGVVLGPPMSSLPFTRESAERALIAFRLSCPSLMRRLDTSGLTRGADWQPACAAAASYTGDARDFFSRWLEAVQIGDGKAYATGYFEPEIAGSRRHEPGYEVPIYGRPADLVDVDLGAFSADLKAKKIRGRVEGSNFIPYYDRSAIDAGALQARAPILAWGADPVEVFFLQVQGSGRLRLPDGGVMRIGYADQNGRDYTGIGALMKSRGLLAPGQSSMQGIMAWLRANPEQGRAIMAENKSFVFFRELVGSPLGALGLAVTGGVSVAADVKFVPLGAPVFLSMDRADVAGIWVAQDTGGAIKGANRFDTFWGAGEDARATAGGMSAHGTAFLLLPIGTAARLNGQLSGWGNGGTPAQP